MGYLKKRRLCRCNKCAREFKSSLVKPACSDASCRSTDVTVLEGPGSEGYSDPPPGGGANAKTPRLGVFQENKQATAALVSEDSFTPDMSFFRTLLDSARIDFSPQVTELIFNGDPHDPAWINQVLMDSGVHMAHKRKFVINYWLAKQGYKRGEINVDAVIGGDGMSGGGSEFDKAMAEMVRARTKAEQMRLMDGPQEEEMVAVEQTDENGRPLGQQIMVPASRWFQLESLKIQASIARGQAKPAEESSLSVFKMLMDIQTKAQSENTALLLKMIDARNARDPRAEELALRQAVQERTSAMEKQLQEVLHAMDKKNMAEEVRGPLVAEMNRMRQEMHQLASAASSSEIHHKMAQEREMTGVVVDTVKGATAEFRAGRHDMKEIATDFLRATMAGSQGASDREVRPPTPEEAEEIDDWLDQELSNAADRGASMVSDAPAARAPGPPPPPPDSDTGSDALIVR